MTVTFTPSTATIHDEDSVFILGEDIRSVAFTTAKTSAGASGGKTSEGNSFVIIITSRQHTTPIARVVLAYVENQPGWTNNLTGAQQAVTDFLAIAGITGSAIVADGNYGDITVSGSGTIWTINAGVVDVTKMTSGVAAAGTVATADGVGGVIYAPAAGGGLNQLTGDVAAGPGTGSQVATIQPLAVDNGKIADGSVDNVKITSGAAPPGYVLTADGATGASWAAGGTGDVVGPASAVDGHIPQFDGTTGKLIKDGLATSLGGNVAADSGKVVLFNAQGQLIASSTTADALLATASSAGAIGVHGVSTGASNTYGVKGDADNGFGVHGFSTNGSGVWGWSINGYGGFFMNNSATNPALHALALAGAEIMHFEDGGITPALIVNANGGLVWRDASAAQTTVNGLPVFGALTKGVVPAAGAVPAATNFLTETGVFAVPAGTGINQLTGDATAGPGSGSQAITLASIITAAGPIGSATVVPIITYDAKGRLTAVTSATVTPAIGSITGLGTGVATALAINISSVGSVLISGGALGTPSSGTLTNATGLPPSTGLTAPYGAHVVAAYNMGTPVNLIGGTTTLTNQTNALAFHNVNIFGPRLDLTGFTDVKFQIGVVTGSASANTPKVILRYFTSFSTTTTDYLDIGTSEVSASLTTAGIIETAWINLAAGAIGTNKYLRMLVQGGDGAADPVTGLCTAFFR